MIGWVLSAVDESGPLGPVDEADRAVMTEEKVRGHIADARPLRIGMTSDRQQQLVLGGCEAGRLGTLLAPT